MEVQYSRSEPEQRTTCTIPGTIPQDLGRVSGTISEVHGSGPADHAELKRLDIVIAAEGESVNEPADLQRIVRRHQVGETVTLSFLRRGTLRKVTVVL